MSGFISNHTYSFMELYPKQYYTPFRTSNNTDIFREFLANWTIVKFFSEYISHNNDTFFTELLLPNNIKNFFKSLRHSNRQKILKQNILNKKWEKLAYTHEADNFAINCSWVYMISHWWLYGRKWPSSPLPKRILVPPIQRVSKKFEIFPAPSYKLQKIFLAQQKNIFMGGGVYTMENKDSMTDYQEVVRVKEQKWEMVEIGTIHIHYFLYT